MQGGAIVAGGNIGAVAIGGDASGSSENAIAAGGAIASVSIKGSLQDANGTGNIEAESIGPLTIGGNIKASRVHASDGIGPVKIKGTIEHSSIASDDFIRSVSISGSIVDSFTEAGAVAAGGKIDFVKVKGSILVQGDGASIFAGVLGPVTVGGDIVGTSVARALISAVGEQATDGTKDLAIASIKVGGRVENADIRAGYSANTPVNADAQIGKVTVGGDWVKSNLVAGVSSADAVFGNSDDVIINEISQVNSIVASIAGITIKGSVLGTFGGLDGFAFTAEEIKAVTIGGVKFKLEAGASNDDLVTSGATQDVRIREVSLI
jgi:hypothetical protein